MPKEKKEIASKWVYKVKYKPNDFSLDRYKTMLVAKGYKQLPGIYFHDSFSLAAKVVTIRMLLAISIANNWPIYPLEINNTHLHGFIEEDLYMQHLEDYTKAKKG